MTYLGQVEILGMKEWGSWQAAAQVLRSHWDRMILPNHFLAETIANVATLPTGSWEKARQKG